MRLFISEFLCGGGCPDPRDGGSLAVEGRSMLCAVVADCLRIPEVQVSTTWDSRLGTVPFVGVNVHLTASPDEEAVSFRQLAADCDATLLIAPEFQDILGRRAAIVESLGRPLVGPGCAAIRLCADKYVLAAVLHAANVRTIPTALLDWDGPLPDAIEYPIVVKPRDGAGSQATRLIRNSREFAAVRIELQDSQLLHSGICQPYFSGKAVSVGLIYGATSRRPLVLPVCEQFLSDEGHFRYQGGCVPARCDFTSEIQAAATRACDQIPGLAGYVGVDLIVPEADPGAPIVVEINPRLTTSYLGYSALTEENLAALMLFPDRIGPDHVSGGVHWRPAPVFYSVQGVSR